MTYDEAVKQSTEYFDTIRQDSVRFDRNTRIHFYNGSEMFITRSTFIHLNDPCGGNGYVVVFSLDFVRPFVFDSVDVEYCSESFDVKESSNDG